MPRMRNVKALRNESSIRRVPRLPGTLQLDFEPFSGSLAFTEKLNVKIDAVVVLNRVDNTNRFKHFPQKPLTGRIGLVLCWSLQRACLRTLGCPSSASESRN